MICLTNPINGQELPWNPSTTLVVRSTTKYEKIHKKKKDTGKEIKSMKEGQNPNKLLCKPLFEDPWPASFQLLQNHNM